MEYYFVVCSPGNYYGELDRGNAYCDRIKACVPCPENKVKTVSGNSLSLCVNCDGANTVPNSDRTGCGKCG